MDIGKEPLRFELRINRQGEHGLFIEGVQNMRPLAIITEADTEVLRLIEAALNVAESHFAIATYSVKHNGTRPA
jgi:hypothetical protein